MLISEKSTYIESVFTDETEIEKVVFDNFEYLFGPSSFVLPKKLIQTPDGAGTIPDGFAIDLENKTWYIVEAELICHPVWTHIAQQITKQLIAAQHEKTRNLIIELVVKLYKESDEIKEKFNEEGIEEINIRKILGEILSKKPIIGIPIDRISEDLKQWANNLNSIVKLWSIKKYTELENKENIIYEFPEEFKPDLNTENIQSNDQLINSNNVYDVTIFDLITEKLLNVNDALYMTYGPRNSEKKEYKAIIKDDGSIEVLNNSFSSPSYAALFCINDAGSLRKTVNGWTSWKTQDGKLLSEIREEFLKNKN